MKKHLYLVIVFCLPLVVLAQDDLPTKDIEIVKEYTPYLEEGDKQRFQPQAPEALPAEGRNATYDVVGGFVEVQNDTDQIRPIPLDYSNDYDSKTAYIKVGYGNFSNPLIKADISKTEADNYSIGLHAGYSGGQGELFDDQKMADMNLRINASKYFEQTTFEAEGGYTSNTDYQYGYDHNLLTLSEDDSKQTFNTIDVNAAVFNKVENNAGIDYRFDVGIGRTADNIFDINEFNTNIEASLSKDIFDSMAAKLAVGAFNRSTENMVNTEDSDVVLRAIPAVGFDINDWKIDLGASINYDNASDIQVFPNATVSKLLGDDRFTFFAGWKGEVIPFGLTAASAVNTHFTDIASLENYSHQVRTPIGIKGKVSPNFAFKASLSQEVSENMPLFVNNNNGLVQPYQGLERSFLLRYEDKLVNWNFTGEANYLLTEKANFLAAVRVNNYTLDSEAEAWHLPDLDVKIGMDVNPIDRLSITGGLQMLSGINYLDAAGQSDNLESILNANVGGQFMITEQIGVFIDANNLANQNFERWKNYESFGLNILGGFVISY